MKFKATIERFKLYESGIPPQCIKELDKARRLHTPERAAESIPVFKSVLEKYGRDLSRNTFAEISMHMGFAYLMTDQLEKSRACVVSIMETPGLVDHYYGNAQVIMAFIEIDYKRFDKARSILDDAESRYHLEPGAYDSARKDLTDAEGEGEDS